MTTRDSSADTDGPPADWLDKLPGSNEGDVFAAGGWGYVPSADSLVTWDANLPRPKPEMVRDDDAKAYREGFRER